MSVPVVLYEERGSVAIVRTHKSDLLAVRRQRSRGVEFDGEADRAS